MRPTLAQSPVFRAASLGAERGFPYSAPPLDQWWTGLPDPELTTLVTRALAENLDLAQAPARSHRWRGVGTVLTLLFLPALYALFFRVPRKVAGSEPP